MVDAVAIKLRRQPQSASGRGRHREHGNTYVREEALVRQFGEILKHVRIPTELAGKLPTVPRESQADKEKFVRASMLRLQQQQTLLRSKLDRVYEDRLGDQIPEELWTAKSTELQDELRRVRTEMERHEGEPGVRSSRVPDSRTRANRVFVVSAKKPHEQARLIKTLVSNSTFDRGTLSPTYIKPFDVFATGRKTGDWLLGLDSCPLAASGASRGVTEDSPGRQSRRRRDWLTSVDNFRNWLIHTAA